MQLRAMHAAMALALSAGASMANPIWAGGDYSWNWETGFGNGGNGSTFIGPYTPGNATPTTIDGPGGGNSSAALSLGYVSQPNLFGIGVNPGSGLSQFDPAGLYNEATLSVTFTASWYINGAFGPAIGFQFWPLTGFVGGAGSYVKFTSTVDFLLGTPFLNTPLRATSVVNYEKNTPGAFSVSLYEAAPLNPAVIIDNYVTLTGTFTFTVKNDGGPTGVDSGEGGSVPSSGSLALLGAGMVVASRRRR